MSDLSRLGEFGLIDRLAKIFKPAQGVIEGIGDDCAVLRVSNTTLLVTCDLSIEAVHFRRNHASPEDVGWKAVAVSLSDIAAMGGVPRFITASLAAPTDADVPYLERIARGMQQAAEFAGASIVGGDTTRSTGGLIIDTMVIGEALAGRYLARSGARPGDVLLITGTLGDAAAGLHAQENGHAAPELLSRLHHPTPRIAEGLWLLQQDALHAMIDISDGLAQDASHIAKASDLAVDIRRANLPVSPALTTYCAEFSLDARELASSGGDDYELALAVAPNASSELQTEFRAAFGYELVEAGHFKKGPSQATIDGAPITHAGFDHFKS